MSTELVKMDDRGRVTLGRLISKRGVKPSEHYQVSFGENQTVILRPVTILVEGAA